MPIIGKLSYEPGNIIGIGSYGTKVFQGFFEGVKTVAIKRLFLENHDKSKIANEAEIIWLVGDHPNILRYFCNEMDRKFMYFLSIF